MVSLESLFSLRGHAALVTGASSGLGVECARALAIAGADVALVARRGDRLEALAAELRKSYGARAVAIAGDVTVEADLDRALSGCDDNFGGVDILVNNAGVVATGPAENLSREVWDRAIAVNLTAPMVLSQKFARRLISAHKPGRIINMCSVFSSVSGYAYRVSAYAASKAALANLTRQLAVEWACHGILVNALAPGWVPTELNEPLLASPRHRERIEASIPLGRVCMPEEIRGAVIFLASPSASYVTGSLLSVDGGYLAW